MFSPLKCSLVVLFMCILIHVQIKKDYIHTYMHSPMKIDMSFDPKVQTHYIIT